MSGKSNDMGRAYEYAWIQALYEALVKERKTRIIENSSLKANKRAWSMLDVDVQNVMTLSSVAAVNTIIELEPRMIEDSEDELLLESQSDAQGVQGDVRDIVIKREGIHWEVGLSIKHNHEAVKHSRLSHSLDFGAEWFGIPCSETYWNAVTPIFDSLKEKKKNKVKWSDLEDKENSVYIPLLHAFMDEVNRANQMDPCLPSKLFKYLIGTQDYYKAISHDNNRVTLILTFNIHGTLNKSSSSKTSKVKIPIVKLPSELIALRLKTGSNSTVEMYLNNGWQLSFRIHNAATIVEPSLKFDVQFVGMPVDVLTIECTWA